MAAVRRAAVCAALSTSLLLLAGAAIAARSPSGLLYSTASNNVVQPQPPAGSCHAIGSGLYSRPDPRCTPGTLNPQVTQVTIGRTICRSGWTSTVRPPESITEPEKFASMRAYGAHGTASDYEYDHFVPLELGGATNDPRNLWPEPGASPNPKDAVEDELKRAVCEERMTLAQAQHAIVSNWVALGPKPAPAAPKPKPKPQPKPSAPKPSGWCSANADYNNTYDDYDVYVESNQPDQDATVSGDGKTASYYTNSSGYADVYFYAGPSAAGNSVSVEVGDATCSTTL
jgi:hypothetical protein